MMETDSADAENEWPYHEYTWSCISADGKTVVDLKPGGREISVGWTEREDFRNAWLSYRLNEFRSQVDHIRKGMGTIVPVQLLSLFTWNELQLNVCGKNEIDIDFLRVRPPLPSSPFFPSLTSYVSFLGKHKISVRILRGR